MKRSPSLAFALGALLCAAGCAHQVRLAPPMPTTPATTVRIDGRDVGPVPPDGLVVDVAAGPAPVHVEADGAIVDVARVVDPGRVAVAAAIAVPVGAAAGSAAWMAMNARQLAGGVLLDPMGLSQVALAPSACTLPVAFAACVAPAVLASPFIVAPPGEIALPSPSSTPTSSTSSASVTGVNP